MNGLFDRHAPICQLAPATGRQKSQCGAKLKLTALAADTRPPPDDRRDHISTAVRPASECTSNAIFSQGR
jgi:hypothetical protein